MSKIQESNVERIARIERDGTVRAYYRITAIVDEFGMALRLLDAIRAEPERIEPPSEADIEPCNLMQVQQAQFAQMKALRKLFDLITPLLDSIIISPEIANALEQLEKAFPASINRPDLSLPQRITLGFNRSMAAFARHIRQAYEAGWNRNYTRNPASDVTHAFSVALKNDFDLEKLKALQLALDEEDEAAANDTDDCEAIGAIVSARKFPVPCPEQIKEAARNFPKAKQRIDAKHFGISLASLLWQVRTKPMKRMSDVQNELSNLISLYVKLLNSLSQQQRIFKG